jgi:hypothetical protein
MRWKSGLKDDASEEIGVFIAVTASASIHGIKRIVDRTLPSCADLGKKC